MRLLTLRHRKPAVRATVAKRRRYSQVLPERPCLLLSSGFRRAANPQPVKKTREDTSAGVRRNLGPFGAPGRGFPAPPPLKTTGEPAVWSSAAPEPAPLAGRGCGEHPEVLTRQRGRWQRAPRPAFSVWRTPAFAPVIYLL